MLRSRSGVFEALKAWLDKLARAVLEHRIDKIVLFCIGERHIADGVCSFLNIIGHTSVPVGASADVPAYRGAVRTTKDQ